MIKGNVTIELHNHKTGLRDRIEGENSITSAFQDVVNRIVANGTAIPNPICQNLLGGIIITDNLLYDDINVPYDAKVIGSGYYNGSNIDSAIVGTYNGIESGYNEAELSFTQVYDFSTTQANGTIKSVCLTNVECGRHPFAYTALASGTNTSVNPYITFDKTKINILYLDENDLYYVLCSTGEIYKIAGYNSMVIRLNDKLGVLPDGVSTGKFVTVPTGIKMYYDGYDGYVYHFSYSSGSLRVSRIKVSDYSFTEDLNYRSFSVYMSSNPAYENNIAIDMNNGYIYTIDQNISTRSIILYRIEYDTGNITEIDLTPYISFYYSYGMFIQSNGSLYIQGKRDSSNYTGVRISNGNYIECDTVVSVNMATPYNQFCGYEKGVVRVTTDCIACSIQLLMSNFNLQETITKTNNQSMKVTYTLRMV